MYTIAKKFVFTASPKEEKFYPPLKTYQITIEQTSISLNREGIVRNIDDMHIIEKFIKNKLHLQYLDTVFYFVPTMENIAKFFFKRFKKEFPLISAVYVEVDMMYARYISSHDEEDHIDVNLKGE